ncbi:hypothetical protein AB0L34_26015 [Micromonospora sp. NPDC052213]|uniref:hypothetical protein n=1 Tax=Micromonospora sp. NPDC052213 TaxID=3155812 RepID=UPI0034333EDC
MTQDQAADIKPGEIYEDCHFHPVLCLYNDGDQIHGISLIDASSPRACSIGFCAVIKLTVDDVIAARADWPGYLERRHAEFEAECDEHTT